MSCPFLWYINAHVYTQFEPTRAARRVREEEKTFHQCGGLGIVYPNRGCCEFFATRDRNIGFRLGGE